MHTYIPQDLTITYSESHIRMYVRMYVRTHSTLQSSYLPAPPISLGNTGGHVVTVGTMLGHFQAQ